MKFIKLLFASALLICAVNISFSQLGNSTNIHMLANLNQHSGPTPYAAIWGYTAPNGREYAILACYNGTSFADITDTNNIHEVAYATGPAFIASNTYTWREMKTFSHYAYIVTDVTNNSQGVQIVDLQYLPDSVHAIGYYNFSGFTQTHTITQSGPYLYMNGGNYNNAGVFILDLTSNPVAPVKRGQWETAYIHDCAVVNDTIYACNIYNPPGTISVINASNKDNLTTINSWVNNPSPGPHNCALTTDHKYCLVTDEINGNPRLLKIWNIQNLANVVQVATWQPTGITTSIVHNVEVYGNYALIGHYTAGFRIVNISNPSAPVEVAWYDTYPANNSGNYAGCWGPYMFPSGKIVVSDMQTGLYVFKTTVDIITEAGNNNSSIPADYSLDQNYPNPFNPSTHISYSLPRAGYITLKVYDVTGKQTALLADEYKKAGVYSISYDASRLSSGIYFYSLSSSDGYRSTKKMVLVK